MGDEVKIPSKYVFGPFLLDAGKHILTKNGEKVPLSPKPMGVLLVLVERAGQLVTVDDLMKEVWGGTTVEENNLTQQIHVLRKELGEHPGANEYIETVPREGYRFVAPVEVDRTANRVPATVDRMAPQVHTYGDIIAVFWPEEPQVTDRSGAVVRAGDTIIVPVIDEDDGKVRDCPCVVVRACASSNELLVLDRPGHVLGILKVGVGGYIYVEADAMGRTDPDKMLALDVDSSLFRKAPVVDVKGDVLKVLVFPTVVRGWKFSARAE